MVCCRKRGIPFRRFQLYTGTSVGVHFSLVKLIDIAYILAWLVTYFSQNMLNSQGLKFVPTGFAFRTPKRGKVHSEVVVHDGAPSRKSIRITCANDH